MRPIKSPPGVARPVANLVAGDPRREWFHLGDVRDEVVGEQGPTQNTRTSADVYVYDVIGGFMGVDADAFVRDVAGLEVDHIDLHLNSPGGSAFEGVAIANVLRQHRADITVWVDGIAASAASVIAMAGDEVVMSVGAQLMIHEAWAFSEGDAAEMRKAAEMLDSMSDSIASTYAARAGGTAADWRAVMQTEAWYTADEAVAAGLADRVASSSDNGSAQGQQVVPGGGGFGFWDLWDSLGDPARHEQTVAALFAHAGRAAAPAPVAAGRSTTKTPAAASAAGGPPAAAAAEGSAAVEFTPEQITTITEALGIPSDSDAQTITDAIVEALNEQASNEGETGASAAALPENAVAIDADVLAELRTKAEAGVTALARQDKAGREALVHAAVRDGRIRPASTDAWLNKLAKDPGAADDLASLTPGLVPTNEIGHAGTEPAEPTADDVRASDAYKNWKV
ncbi:Clp protease ClpP [Rhodococcus aerolatus]